MEAAALAQEALRWLWPQTCAHCREDLAKDDPGPLCRACHLTLTPHEPPYCLRCCEPVAGGSRTCPSCPSRLKACSMIRSAFLYRQAGISVVHAFKFRGRRTAARAAGEEMGRAWPRFPELGRPDALVPMPLHPARRRQRGYNQALLMAESLALLIGIPVQELAQRRKSTRPQWALNREQRRENLESAFSGLRAAAGQRLLIIDDVCTSGASLEACAGALKAAGAAAVAGYVFARQTLGPI